MKLTKLNDESYDIQDHVLYDDPILDRCFKLAALVEPIRSARIVAAVTKRNRIISIAQNVRKSDPLQKEGSSVICKNCDRYRTMHLFTRSTRQMYLRKVCDNFIPNDERIYLHAETLAIKRAKRYFDDLTGCILYVVRAKQDQGDWVFGNAKPCPSCMDLTREAGIKEVRYT